MPKRVSQSKSSDSSVLSPDLGADIESNGSKNSARKIVSLNSIRIRGARQHNLKNVDLELPRDRLIVFTGVSGSGKSSLAFDTIFAEGQGAMLNL